MLRLTKRDGRSKRLFGAILTPQVFLQSLVSSVCACSSGHPEDRIVAQVYRGAYGRSTQRWTSDRVNRSETGNSQFDIPSIASGRG